MGLRGYTDADM